jgi:predicted small secreted protein
MRHIKKITLLSALFSAVLALSACGTVKGFGQDVTHAGQDIQKAATH